MNNHLRLPVQHNGAPAIVTLHANEWLHLPASGGHTDEGYHWVFISLIYRPDKRRVDMALTEQYRDCDGRGSTYLDMRAAVHFQKLRRNATRPIIDEVFTVTDETCNDYTAQAAGY